MVKASAPRGSTAQAAKPMTKKAKAQETKAQNAFVNSMLVSVADDAKKDRDYCIQMIHENPTWVPYLAASFRKGRFQKFVSAMQEEEQEAETEEFGRTLPSSLKCLVKLQPKLKYDVLVSLRPYLAATPFSHVKMPALDSAFKYVLHIDDATPFPTEDLARRFQVFISICKARDKDVGQRALKTGLELAEAGCFPFFEIIEAEGAAGGQLKVQYVPLNQAKPLPINPAGEEEWEWEIGDPCDFHAEITCKQNPAMKLVANAFFPDAALDTKEQWTYEWDDIKEEFPLPTPSASGGSASTVATPKKGRRLSAKMTPAKRLSFMVSPSLKKVAKK